MSFHNSFLFSPRFNPELANRHSTFRVSEIAPGAVEISWQSQLWPVRPVKVLHVSICGDVVHMA